ncbi:type II toxin-antitoxin system VapC family toxin [Paraburkholderia sp.]|uniref:type II toxin-antitoxin system VapC family toxin n=1 Tax=Paraburkholderia sp. TaxID=1926495 RepID=UPI003D6FC2F8
MNVLIDTSVWVEHFRRPDARLQQLLRIDAAITHPLVILELTCGTPPGRTRTLGDLALLRHTGLAPHDEVGGLVERERLFGPGCGAVDCTLLASTMLTPETQIWTSDLRLARLADRFGVRYTYAGSQ